MAVRSLDITRTTSEKGSEVSQGCDARQCTTFLSPAVQLDFVRQYISAIINSSIQ
jgi:hypothetical protein